MALLEAKDLTFYYPEQPHPALDAVRFSIKPGEFVVIGGPSGSGKSTLLRLLKKDIAPHGELTGSIWYNGCPFLDVSPNVHAFDFGFVFQDPENQIVMEHVQDELIFGMENRALTTSEMRRRLAEMTHAFGLEDMLDRKTIDLSGGQKQWLNLASVLLLEPNVLLLDEPTSQLDPVAAKEFLQLVKQTNEEFGVTVIIVEHRLDDVLPLADRLMILNHGKLQFNGTPRAVLEGMLDDKGKNSYPTYLPVITKLYATFSKDQGDLIPLSVKEGRQWLSRYSVSEKRDQVAYDNKNGLNGMTPLLEARDIEFQYDRLGPRILDNLKFSVMGGELLAIVGGNGTGKSTLLKVLSGLIKPQRGALLYKGERIKKDRWGHMGYLPQNPKLLFLHDTVEQELLSVTEKIELLEGKQLMNDLLVRFELDHVKSHHPYDLSGGEMQKVALISLLLRNPDILLIDEPTKGLDPTSKQVLGCHLKELIEEGKTIVLVTHDLEFAATYATRCAMLFKGQITTEGEPDVFFKGNLFYTTVISRLTRHLEGIPEVVTLEEAEKIWGRKQF